MSRLQQYPDSLEQPRILLLNPFCFQQFLVLWTWVCSPKMVYDHDSGYFTKPLPPKSFIFVPQGENGKYDIQSLKHALFSALELW